MKKTYTIKLDEQRVNDLMKKYGTTSFTELVLRVFQVAEWYIPVIPNGVEELTKERARQVLNYAKECKRERDELMRVVEDFKISIDGLSK